MSANNYSYGGRGLGFFTVLLILTLNAESGKDLLDVTVDYWEAKTNLVREEVLNERQN